jgi:hypothetical protein
VGGFVGWFHGGLQGLQMVIIRRTMFSGRLDGGCDARSGFGEADATAPFIFGNEIAENKCNTARTMRRSRTFPAKESSGFGSLPLPHNHPERPPAGEELKPGRKTACARSSSHSPSRRINRQNQRAFFQKTSPIENRDLPLFQPNTFAKATVFADRKKV